MLIFDVTPTLLGRTVTWTSFGRGGPITRRGRVVYIQRDEMRWTDSMFRQYKSQRAHWLEGWDLARIDAECKNNATSYGPVGVVVERVNSAGEPLKPWFFCPELSRVVAR